MQPKRGWFPGEMECLGLHVSDHTKIKKTPLLPDGEGLVGDAGKIRGQIIAIQRLSML